MSKTNNQQPKNRGKERKMKSRMTVNGLKISYDEETDEITFQKGLVILTLKMGEDMLNLLYHMTPYGRYQKFLFEEQDKKCADCKKQILYDEAILHHEPRLGSMGARYIDFQHSTRNRMLCEECHKKMHLKEKQNINIPKLTVEIRESLMKIKLDKEQVLKLLKDNNSIWTVTEMVYNRKFDHNDRRTWIFYQKVNNIRHSSNVPNNPNKEV
jgi:hypothetical protein